MMAAAMAARNSTGTAYLELARARATLARTLPSSACPRLASEVVSIEPLAVDLQFSLDDQQRIRVAGKVDGLCRLPCQRCDRDVEYSLQTNIEGLLAENEEQARQMTVNATQDDPVVVIAGRELDIATLIEDELILGIPQQVCLNDHCEHLPALSYGPQAAEQTETVSQPSPFAVLAELSEARNSENE